MKLWLECMWTVIWQDSVFLWRWWEGLTLSQMKEVVNSKSLLKTIISWLDIFYVKDREGSIKRYKPCLLIIVSSIRTTFTSSEIYEGELAHKFRRLRFTCISWPLNSKLKYGMRSWWFFICTGCARTSCGISFLNELLYCLHIGDFILLQTNNANLLFTILSHAKLPACVGNKKSRDCLL